MRNWMPSFLLLPHVDSMRVTQRKPNFAGYGPISWADLEVLAAKVANEAAWRVVKQARRATFLNRACSPLLLSIHQQHHGRAGWKSRQFAAQYCRHQWCKANLVLHMKLKHGGWWGDEIDLAAMRE